MSLSEKVLTVVNDPMFRKVIPWIALTLFIVCGALVLFGSCNRSLDKSVIDPTKDIPQQEQLHR